MPRRKLPTPPRLSNTGYVDKLPQQPTHTKQSVNLTCVFDVQAGAEISTVNPEQYSKRFYDFITTILS